MTDRMSNAEENSQSMRQSLLRSIPSIDSLLSSVETTPLLESFGRAAVIEALQQATKQCRVHINAGSVSSSKQELLAQILTTAGETLSRASASSLVPVFNASGTVLHTNLGRATLPQQSIDAIVGVAKNPSNIEFDLSSGRRGDRDAHVEQRICDLTGAEAATLVNNNAAAVLLVLNSLADGAQVAVSRGELVEIGGSFRVPDVMKKAGCELLEIGTTNRTHKRDFEIAIEAGVSAIMRVHTSNYKVEGFSASVAEADLAVLCKHADIPFINDLGSGVLVDLKNYGMAPEPTVKQAIEDGSDVVTFSGDKLLGGPQCGFVVGKKRFIDIIRRNPLKRALRCDKHTIAALEALLRLYSNPESLQQHLPALRYLTRPLGEIDQVAQTVLPAIEEYFKQTATVQICVSQSQIGSGALPVDSLDSVAVVITPLQSKDTANDLSPPSVNEIAVSLRQLSRPVIGRIHRNAVWLDMRCIDDVAAFTANFRP